MTAKRSVTEMETYTGKYVDLLDPKPEQITLADIAVGLSNCCRFGNQVNRFYSVAEHSVRCAAMTEGHAACGINLPMACLFHDAHEAYTGDITAPLKQVLGESLREVQHRLDVAIVAELGLEHDLYAIDLKHPLVKAVDDAVMFREAAGLKYSHGIGDHWGNDEYYEPLVDYGWTPAEAERRFIETYERLTHE